MKKTISIIGGGASALILGCELNTEKYTVSIFEKNTALARKFLVAGDGGLNLTHSEDEKKFVLKYTPHEFLESAFKHFSNKDLIKWLNDLGIETFEGSSGRIFPKKELKPIEVLNRIEEKIKNNHITLNFKHEWMGFSSSNELLFKTLGGNKEIKSDIVIFCLGGASWSVTGSKGDWLSYFSEKKIKTINFEASNCSFKIDWPKEIIKNIEGKPLKNISIKCGNKVHVGEVVITSFGMEGSGIYPLTSQIREALNRSGIAKIYIDLKPLVTSDNALKKIIDSRSNLSYTDNCVKQLNLNKTQIILLKSVMSKSDFLDPIKFVNNLKNLELSITALGSIEDAISTVGGISLTEISEKFELKKIKNNFVIGEMLDYDAPTGGYLLQSCFSMGKYLADHLNNF